MGFFSQDCRGCGHSVRAPQAVTKPSRWMNEVVVIEKDGSRYMGRYDGYGRVIRQNGAEVEDAIGMKDNEVWHRTCWHLAGKPGEFTKASRGSRDQGFFVGEYDPTEPKTVEEMNTLKAEGDRRDEKERAEWKKAMEEYEAKKREKTAS